MVAREPVRFHYQDQEGNAFSKTTPFEGVIPNLERRYHEQNQNLYAKIYTNILLSVLCKLVMAHASI